MKSRPVRWLASTIGKRGYIARYLREASPTGSAVIGTGNDPFTPGFMSCDAAYLMPSIGDPEYLSRVVELCARERITAALSLSDLDVPALARVRDQLTDAGVACFFPDPVTAERFVDKVETARFLRSHGLATPPTFSHLGAAFDAVGTPLVVKPRRGSASEGLAVCYDHDSAWAAWSRAHEPIAQPYLAGCLVNVEACSCPGGSLLALSAWRRHRSVGGETLLAETVEHPRALELAKTLLAASPIPGPIDIDMIETHDQLWILEVNTRFGGGYPTSHLAGADFPGAMVEALAGHRGARPMRSARPNVVMMKELLPVYYERSRVAVAEPPAERSAAARPVSSSARTPPPPSQTDDSAVARGPTPRR